MRRRGKGPLDESEFESNEQGTMRQFGERRESDIQRAHLFAKAETMFGPMQTVAIELRAAILATGITAGCYLLYWFKAVLIPFFLAIFLM